MVYINNKDTMKTCIITGANAGIGRSAAFQLASEGCRVVMVCRNIKQAEEVCLYIKKETGNNQVFARRVDLSLMTDIHRFAKEFANDFNTLDILINNAADFDISRKKPLITAEGNEAQFATNLLAPFLLMQEMLPLIRQSRDGRIINISSKGLITQPNLAFDYDNIRGEKGYNPAKTYYQTKFGLLMLSLALQRRISNSSISVYAVRVTNVKVEMSRYPNVSPIMKAIYRLKSNFAISPDDMAKIYVSLAVGEKLSGFYFDEKLREVRCNKNIYDESAQEKLWNLCGQLVAVGDVHA